VDVLSNLLGKAVQKQHIVGALSNLIPGGISHIQYADDTVIMTDGSDTAILNLKLILYCFEWMSGLKINYHKSEVYVFGATQQEKEKVANMLNCKLGVWPMKYLGIPISEQRLGVNAFSGIKDKMRKRLDLWKGKHLSSGGKLILTNSCLTSLPMYTMGFFLLPKKVHEGMDSIRGRFFWQGAEEEFKYHVAKINTISRPKDQGGMGVINTKIMNECLLVKWIWKIVKGSNDTWYRLLRAKYMPDDNFFNSKSHGTSQFWQGLHKVKHLFKWGAEYKIKNGEQALFWEDVWLGSTPLKIQFPDLYKFCDDPEALVADYFSADGWEIGFRRTLTVGEAEQRNALLEKLQEVVIDPTHKDEVVWVLDKSKNFTTKSLYRFITYRGVGVANAKNIWKTKLPLKIKVFLWQISNNKLQTATELKKRAWKGNTQCCLCGKEEDTDHIYFRCSLAQFAWCCIRDIFGWDSFPTSWEDLQGGWLSQKLKVPYKIGLFVFVGLAWALWKTRNKMAIEKLFPSSPVDVIRSGVTFVQKWASLLKDADQKMIAGTLGRIKEFLKDYKLNEATTPDIIMI
jgi:hypothetical protein